MKVPGLRSLLRLARRGAPRTHRHPDLGRLSFHSGTWRGELRHGDKTLRLALASTDGEPEADILQVAVEAVRGLDRFVPVARGFLAFQPEYGGTSDVLMPIGISVVRPDPAHLRTRLLNEGTVPLRYAPQGQPIWGLQLRAPGESEVLEVFFYRGIPMFADHRSADRRK